MSFYLRSLIGGLIVPAVLAWAVAAFAVRRQRAGGRAGLLGAAPLWAAPLAVAVGSLVAYFLIGGGVWSPPFQDAAPAHGWQTMPYMFAAGAVLAGCVPRGRFRIAAVPGVLLIFALLAAWLLIPNRRSLAETRLQIIAALAAAVFLESGLLLLFLRRVRRDVPPDAPAGEPRSPGMIPATVLGLSVAAVGGFQMLDFSASGAQGGLAVAMALLGVAVAARRDVTGLLSAGLIPVAVAALLGFLWNNRLSSFTEIPIACYVLLAIAPLGLWVAELPPLRRSSRRIRATAAVVASAIPAIAACLWTLTINGLE